MGSDEKNGNLCEAKKTELKAKKTELNIHYIVN